MFSFTLSQKFNARGISSDLILPAARNRFDQLSTYERLDRRLQVRLSEKAIHFLFYQDKMNDPVIEEKYKEVASISLTDPKETEYDILYLAEQCAKKCTKIFWGNEAEKKEWVECFNNSARSLIGGDGKKHGKALRFADFPFIKKWQWTENDCQKWFVFYFQCSFLYFILDLESRDSDFSKSPVYDHVRNQLSQSLAYRLLSAKIQFSLYHFEGEEHQSKDEFSFKTRKYASLLMDQKINEVIPSSFYYEGLWFGNPEIELEYIVRKNASARKDVQLEDHLLLSIQNFLFRKHAVISAMHATSSKWTYPLYIIYLGIIILFSIFTIWSLLKFDQNPQPVFIDLFYKHTYIWTFTCIVSVIILLFLAFGSRSLNVFMPRVLVALGIGWLTAFISEDLIKSQIDIDANFTAIGCLCVLLLICILLFGEAKQQSPFYMSIGGHVKLSKRVEIKKDEKFKWLKRLGGWITTTAKWLWLSIRPSSCKLWPILAHSIFWALTLGAIMQFAMYEGLLEKSKALSEIVYAEPFEDAESYIMHLSNLKEALTNYRQDLDAILVKTTLSGIVKGPRTTSFLNAELGLGSSDIERIRERWRTKITNLENKSRQLDLFVNSLGVCDSVNIASGIVRYDTIADSISRLSERLEPLDTPAKLSQATVDQIISEQLNCLDKLIVSTEEEIQCMRLFISENDNYQKLIAWSDYEEPSSLKGAISIDTLLIQKAKERHYSRKVKMFWIRDKEDNEGTQIKMRDNIRLFPRMLIFHALIVLIIAFVGQLIISDKSVTEPL